MSPFIPKIDHHTFQPQEVFEENRFVFFYIEEGTLLAETEGTPLPYTTGHVFLLPPERPLISAGKERVRVLLLSFSQGAFYELLPPQKNVFCDSLKDPSGDYLPIKRLLLEITEYMEGEASDLPVMGRVYLLFDELARHSADFKAPSSLKYSDRIREISSYIDAHYTEQLTLTELAEEFYLTPQYLSNFFHENFGINFKSYLNQLRLFHVEKALRYTNLSMSEVAESCGFSSMSSFRKNFEARFHMPPTEYRNAWRQKADNPLHFGSSKSEEVLPSSGLLQQDPLSVNRENPMHKNAETIPSIGSVGNLLSTRFRSCLLDTCRELTFRYIRIQEILSSSFIPMIDRDGSYYFQNLDTLLAFLHDHSLVPFLDLTNVQIPFPFLDPERRSFCFIRRGPRFFRILKAFLSHVKKRWPESWLREWRFELGILPDDTPESFASDFAAVKSLIRRFLPECAVGGPCVDLGVGSIRAESILSALKAQKVKPDFFSLRLHLYEADPGKKNGEVRISNDQGRLSSVFNEFLKSIRPELSSLPIYVTEWDSAQPGGLPISLSRYQAVFFLKSVFSLDSSCDLIAYPFLGNPTRNNELLPRFPTVFPHGILSLSPAESPLYYACLSYHWLGSEILAQGSNFRLTRSDENRFQFLILHYAHFRPGLSITAAGISEFDRLYEIFQDSLPIETEYTLTDLPPGLYHIRRIILDPEHGSTLDTFIREFRQSNLTVGEFLQYIQAPMETEFHSAANLPEEQHFYRKLTGELKLPVRLPPHSFCIWDVKRLL